MRYMGQDIIFRVEVDDKDGNTYYTEEFDTAEKVLEKLLSIKEECIKNEDSVYMLINDECVCEDLFGEHHPKMNMAQIYMEIIQCMEPLMNNQIRRLQNAEGQEKDAYPTPENEEEYWRDYCEIMDMYDAKQETDEELLRLLQRMMEKYKEI